jgi:hypothetical protein
MGVIVHDDGGIQVNGRWLTTESMVSITGERGKFRYLSHNMTSSGKVVLNFVGGNSSHQMLRSFYPERVKTVHNTKKGR